MLNLHSTASVGILSAFPAPNLSGGVAFTSRPPDLNFEMRSNDTDHEMDVKVPVQSLHAEAKYTIQQESGNQEIEIVDRGLHG
jgi:hypothetical protein